MKVIDYLIASLGKDSTVREVYSCVLWTAGTPATLTGKRR